MKEIKAYIRPAKLQSVLDAFHSHPDLPGVTCSEVTGFGRHDAPQPGVPTGTSMTKIEVVVPAEQAAEAVRILLQHAHTGRKGDGMVFVSPVDEALRIRIGLPEEP